MVVRKKIFIKGVVQGVGFRPFVYKIASKNSLVGFVRNDSNGVFIEIEGKSEDIELFLKEIHTNLPPLAKIYTIDIEDIPVKNEENFKILNSNRSNKKTTLVSPDIATCKDCLKDMKNVAKYRDYFATNCTNCGPRYTIIKTLPYDRINTSMSKFQMCGSCQKEYSDPKNRRYHAQPISCNSCGPILDGDIKIFAEYIKKGEIVAIKGIGGFHIICDSTNDKAIRKLRKYKNRPTKPFAIMCKNIEQIKSFAKVDKKEEETLLSKEAPIVILKKKQILFYQT